jgi:hypothetical protein
LYRILLTQNDRVFPIYFTRDFNEGDICSRAAVKLRGGERQKRQFEEQRPMTKQDSLPVLRRKVVLAGAEPAVQGLISTFLHTMGWSCSVVQKKEEVPDILQQEVFDAVVFDLGRSAAEAERTILKIKEVRPSLADRMLALTSGATDRRVLEVMERYRVMRLLPDGLLPQLWATLQELVAYPRSRDLPSRAMPVARMMFDSLRNPVAAGVRGSPAGARQLAYQYKKTIIDVSIEFAEGSSRMSLAGQVLDSERKGKNESLPVLLVNEAGTLARTTTNRYGEFQMECDFPEELSLEIRLAERSWVLVPLGKMDWGGKGTPRWLSQTNS